MHMSVCVMQFVVLHVCIVAALFWGVHLDSVRVNIFADRIVDAEVAHDAEDFSHVQFR